MSPCFCYLGLQLKSLCKYHWSWIPKSSTFIPPVFGLQAQNTRHWNSLISEKQWVPMTSTSVYLVHGVLFNSNQMFTNDYWDILDTFQIWHRGWQNTNCLTKSCLLKYALSWAIRLLYLFCWSKFLSSIHLLFSHQHALYLHVSISSGWEYCSEPRVLHMFSVSKCRSLQLNHEIFISWGITKAQILLRMKSWVYYESYFPLNISKIKSQNL